MLRFLFSIVIKIEWNKEQFKKVDIAFAGETIPLREKLLDNPEDAEDIMQEVFLKLWYMRGELDYYNLDYFFMSRYWIVVSKFCTPLSNNWTVCFGK